MKRVLGSILGILFTGIVLAMIIAVPAIVTAKMFEGNVFFAVLCVCVV